MRRKKIQIVHCVLFGKSKHIFMICPTVHISLEKSHYKFITNLK